MDTAGGAGDSSLVPGTRRRGGRSTAALDCRSCGACCAPEVRLPFYVGLSAADLRRLSARFRDRNVARGSILTRLDTGGNVVCVALHGTLGQRASCRIYPRRPGPCRRLTLGSRSCHKARRQAGLE